MLQQHRIDGLLHYMAEMDLEQMVIRNPVLIRYFLGYQPRGNDRATILYVSKNNGVKLIVNELTVFPKDLGLELVLHGDQDDVCALIAQHTLTTSLWASTANIPPSGCCPCAGTMPPAITYWPTVPLICSAPIRTKTKWSCCARPAA